MPSGLYIFYLSISIIRAIAKKIDFLDPDPYQWNFVLKSRIPMISPKYLDFYVAITKSWTIWWTLWIRIPVIRPLNLDLYDSSSGFESLWFESRNPDHYDSSSGSEFLWFARGSLWFAHRDPDPYDSSIGSGSLWFARWIRIHLIKIFTNGLF